MGIKFPRPLVPPTRTGGTSGLYRRAPSRLGAERQERLQQRLHKSIQDRRRVAAAYAGLPQGSSSTNSANTVDSTHNIGPSSQSKEMTHNDIRDHIKTHLERRGSWIERRIARLQTEVKNMTSGDK